MGQQQLLLLVLGIVIVGIAAVAGIEAFSEGKDKAEREAAVSDAMRLISDIQAWNLKPAAFGGGSEANNFGNVSFGAIGIDPSNDKDPSTTDTYETSHGCYALNADGHTLTIYTADCGTKIAHVDITGSTPGDIAWTYGAN